MPTGIYLRHQRKQHPILKCGVCGKEFGVFPCHATGRKKYCSWKCRNLSKRVKGEKANSWKGGIYKSKNSYTRCYSPVGCRLQHRKIMEDYLGRKLNPTEIVHHINGIKTDNRVENLIIFNSLREHMRFHRNAHTISTKCL